MKQALAPGNSTTFDQLQLVITRTRHGEGLGIAMRDEGVAGEFDVVVWQVNRSMRAYGIIREGDRVLTIGGKPARNAARARKRAFIGPCICHRLHQDGWKPQGARAIRGSIPL